ncbi:MAG: FAD-dependent oxidoreductase [Jiangellaceae bacterium]|nr:FAD-dependent oxidoreductase [Jiangellaceae bacterium]
MEVVVIGCGVIGLSAAVRLQEAGFPVRIIARDLPPATTSSVAAAIWYPYRAYPQHRVLDWGRRTLAVFHELAGERSAGILLRDVTELFRFPTPDPWWLPAVDGIRRCTVDEVPPAYGGGLTFRTAVVEMPVYLRYLTMRFHAAGGRIEQGTLDSLAEAGAGAAAVVNCSGLGARQLTHDRQLLPIRGQVVLVENPGVDQVLLDESDPHAITYVVPRSTDCVLGGTAEAGAKSLEPDVATAEAIVERCTKLEPRLAGARLLAHRVGLRPGRPAVRLEPDHLPDGTPCVHNYGHGGSGVTLSWGCADDVVGLIRAALPE